MDGRGDCVAVVERWHGTTSGYRYHGCRCDLCREANTAACRAYAHRSGRHKPRGEYLAELAQTAAVHRHGTESRYTNERCRCDLCGAASAEGQRARRTRRGMQQAAQVAAGRQTAAEQLRQAREQATGELLELVLEQQRDDTPYIRLPRFLVSLDAPTALGVTLLERLAA